MTTEVKTCTKCDTTYIADTIEGLTEYFYKSGKNDGKLRTVCKKCFNSNSQKSKASKNNHISTDSNGLFIKKCTKCDTIYNSNNIEGLSQYFSYFNKEINILSNTCKHCKNKVYYNKYTSDELVKLKEKLEDKLRIINEIILEKQN